MRLATAPDQYNQTDQDQMRGEIAREDKKNLKSGTVFDSILIRDTVTGIVKTLTVASGALVIT